MGGGRPPWVRPNVEYLDCHICGETWSVEVIDGLDISPEDEYYPQMVPICPGGCSDD